MSEHCICGCSHIIGINDNGPCNRWEQGMNGRCVYCDHSMRCHEVRQLQAELEAARKEIDLDNKIIQAADEVYHEQKAQITSLRVALKKITKPEGVYSRDHYQHAKNTIEWIIETAQDALKGGELEADRDRRIGNYEEFDTMDDLINSLEGGDEVE